MYWLHRHGWCHMKLQPSRYASSVYTIQPCTMSLHAKPHMQGGCVFSCNLHFWQNDQDLSCTTAVTWGWNGYRNKSQHRKSTLDKKILLLLLQEFKPATFQTQVRRSNHWATPTCLLSHCYWQYTIHGLFFCFLLYTGGSPEANCLRFLIIVLSVLLLV